MGECGEHAFRTGWMGRIVPKVKGLCERGFLEECEQWVEEEKDKAGER